MVVQKVITKIINNISIIINILDEIPIKFNKVSGYFNCSNNRLTSLENCPKYVGKTFRCDENNLTSLEHSPEFVGGDFDCYWNPLESLDGLKIPYKNFYCIINFTQPKF